MSKPSPIAPNRLPMAFICSDGTTWPTYELKLAHETELCRKEGLMKQETSTHGENTDVL